MPLRIVTADERIAVANAKTTVAIFGPAGAGKTSLARTLPPAETIVIDLEAGMKSLQGRPGDSIRRPTRTASSPRRTTVMCAGSIPTSQR